MSEISEVKKILRSQIRAALRELTKEERAESDQELCQQFLQHPSLEKAQTILMYYGVGTEIHTDAILEELLKQGKTVCTTRPTRPTWPTAVRLPFRPPRPMAGSASPVWTGMETSGPSKRSIRRFGRLPNPC